MKNAFGYDDSLDVFGIHCVGGILGAIVTGILVNPALGGAGIADYIAKPGDWSLADYVLSHGRHGPGEGRAASRSLVGHRFGDPLQDRRRDRRPARHAKQEREGLDIAEHGERAYNY